MSIHNNVSDFAPNVKYFFECFLSVNGVLESNSKVPFPGGEITAKEWGSLKAKYAEFFANHGFLILLLPPGQKSPNKGDGNWKVRATNDPETIHKWFAESPCANYGIWGAGRGFIIDVDNKKLPNGDRKHGSENWEGYLAENNLTAPPTLTAATPNAGFHLFYLAEGQYSDSAVFCDHVDLKAQGYVVGPGCFYNGINPKNGEPDGVPGFYTVARKAVPADAPAWMTDALKVAKPKAASRDDSYWEPDLPEAVEEFSCYLESADTGICGVDGNNTAYKHACFGRDFGLSEEMCLSMMLGDLWNSRCEPPWDAGELSVIVASAYRNAENRAGAKLNIIERFEQSLANSYSHGGAKTNGSNGPDSGWGASDEADAAEEPKWSGIKLYTGAEFMRRGRRREYIIPGWLLAHGFTAINASRGTGKSAVMFDLMMRVSHGLDWDGLPIKDGYTAVYLCGEDDEGLEVSMNAWTIHHKVESSPIREPIIADGIPNLMSWTQTKLLAEEIRVKVGENAKCIVFLDTWQRATTRAKQNADEDMQACIEHAEQLAVMLGGPLVVAFHPPKDGRNTILGSSVIENCSTAIWQISEHKEPLHIRLEVTRIKGSGRYQYRDIEFNVVDTGERGELGNVEDAVVPLFYAGDYHKETDPRLAEAQNILANAKEPMSLKALATMVATTLGEKPEAVRTHFRNNCPGIDWYRNEKTGKYRDPQAVAGMDLEFPN